MRLLSATSIKAIIRRQGLANFLGSLTERIAADFVRWDEFNKSERHTTHYEHGVLELMPCSNQTHYSVKYINGHPGNVARGLPSILSIGMLASVDTGMPLILTEMGFLTALRTAAVTALGVRYLARKNSHRIGIIGTGAQSEFQLIALSNELSIQQVKYFDIDVAAMKKFSRNLDDQGWTMTPSRQIQDVLTDIDVLVTATAARRKAVLFSADQIASGLHIHALGGDCPGKTELPAELVARSTLVVEFLPQTQCEGEMQNLFNKTQAIELHELVRGRHQGRSSYDEITLFDAVGFALEDFSALMLINELAEAYDIGESLDLLASPKDPKDLYGLLMH